MKMLDFAAEHERGAGARSSAPLQPQRDAAGVRVKPSASASAIAAGPTWASAAASAATQVVRLRKSNTDRPEAKRAVRPVGSTWFGPAT